MKNIIKGIFIALLLFGITSCKPDEDSTRSLGEVPTSESIKVDVTFDSENANIVHFAIEADKILTFSQCDKAGIKTTDKKISKLMPWAGEYILTVYAYNANGSSKPINITFTVAEDLYARYLSGGIDNPNGKAWRIANNVFGAIGCGPENSLINEWWGPEANSLSPDLYDDDLVFYAANDKLELRNYGKSFMNETLGNLFPDGDPAGSFTTEYYIPSDKATWRVYRDDASGDSYIDMMEGFPAYPVNPETLNKGTYKIITLSETDMHIVYLPGGIAWNYHLTSAPR